MINSLLESNDYEYEMTYAKYYIFKRFKTEGIKINNTILYAIKTRHSCRMHI